MNEIERATYAGLTISDKPALEDAKARGAEWVAREGNEEGDLFAYRKKPEKDLELSFWNSVDERWIGIENEMLQFIQWSDAEPVNIDLALTQIAEMESAEKPMTWNERINQMTVEEKAKWFDAHMDWCPFDICTENQNCEYCYAKFLNSPYTEGEKK